MAVADDDDWAAAWKKETLSVSSVWELEVSAPVPPRQTGWLVALVSSSYTSTKRSRTEPGYGVATVISGNQGIRGSASVARLVALFQRRSRPRRSRCSPDTSRRMSKQASLRSWRWPKGWRAWVVSRRSTPSRSTPCSQSQGVRQRSQLIDTKRHLGPPEKAPAAKPDAVRADEETWVIGAADGNVTSLH